jgi:hypothetical protein
VAVFFPFMRDGITVKGNERLHIDEDGLIDASKSRGGLSPRPCKSRKSSRTRWASRRCISSQISRAHRTGFPHGSFAAFVAMA